MEFKWTIKAIKDKVTVGNWLDKQQIVVVAEDRNQICIDFLWENIKLLNWFKEWDDVKVSMAFAINCTANGAIFNRISGTSISLI